MKNLVLCLGLIGLGLNGVGCVEALPLADQALFSAAKAGDLNAVNNAIAAGANVNAQDAGGYKPLDYCLAAMHNNGISYVEHAELYDALRTHNNADAATERRIRDYYAALSTDYNKCADALRARGAETRVVATFMRPFDSDTDLAGLHRRPFRPITEAERARINE